MNTLLDKITAILMMVGAVMMFLSMGYSIVLLFLQPHFKFGCFLLFVLLTVACVVLFKEGVKQYKGEEL